MRSWIFFIFFIKLLLIRGASQEFCLDLETAWLRALNNSPAMALSEVEIAITQAQRIQENLTPNPIALIEGENLGVDNTRGEADVPETTYSVSRLWELGGKRKARRELADSQIEIAFWEKEIAREDLRFDLVRSFIQVALSQEKYALIQAKRENTQKRVEISEAFLREGKMSPLENKKMHIALKSALVEENEAYSLVIQEKTHLSSLWGSSLPDFENVAFDLFNCTEDFSCGEIAYIPEIILAHKKIIEATKNVDLQRAIAVPDMTVTLGCRTYADSSQVGWIVAAAMPIPVCNKNQGNIQKAYSEVHQAEILKEQIALEIQKEASLLYERVKNWHEQSCLIEKELLREAIETFDLTKKGYDQGKLAYQDLLEAEVLVITTQEKLIESLGNYHLSKAELDRLSGRYRYL